LIPEGLTLRVATLRARERAVGVLIKMRWAVLATVLRISEGGVGAMKWIIAFDQDDLTLVIAVFVSGVAISLALL